LNSIIEEVSSENELMKKVKNELNEEKDKNKNYQKSQKYEDYIKKNKI
jgi:hypothetical protein